MLKTKQKALWLLLFFVWTITAGALPKKNFSPMSRATFQLTPFPFIYNKEIKRWISFFTERPSFVSLWLARSYRYLPLMKKILKSQGLPEELAYTTLIESSLSPLAVSSAQAVGYWQFISPTARRFHLTVNDWLDERRDFEKSTRAAGKYLTSLYLEFRSWPLSLSAYNMGESRLRKLIKKYKTRNFWILFRKKDFPRETALYVPKILAVIHIMKSPESYGFTQFTVLEPHDYDLFYVPGGTNIKTLAGETNIPFDKLKVLNPELKTHFIPKHIPNHRIRIPKGTALLLSAWLRTRK